MIKDLPSMLSISARMLHGYRSGKYPLTEKAWRKLEALESESGLDNRSFRSDGGPDSEMSGDEIMLKDVFAKLHECLEMLEELMVKSNQRKS